MGGDSAAGTTPPPRSPRPPAPTPPPTRFHPCLLHTPASQIQPPCLARRQTARQIHAAAGRGGAPRHPGHKYTHIWARHPSRPHAEHRAPLTHLPRLPQLSWSPQYGSDSSSPHPRQSSKKSPLRRAFLKSPHRSAREPRKPSGQNRRGSTQQHKSSRAPRGAMCKCGGAPGSLNGALLRAHSTDTT